MLARPARRASGGSEDRGRDVGRPVPHEVVGDPGEPVIRIGRAAGRRAASAVRRSSASRASGSPATERDERGHGRVQAASPAAGSHANIDRTIASTTCGRTARTTCPAAVSTTASRAARSWSASRSRGRTRGGPRDTRRGCAAPRAARRGRGGTRRRRRPLSPRAAPSRRRRARAPAHRSPSAVAVDEPHDRAEPVTRDHDPAPAEEPGALRDRDGVRRKRRRVVARHRRVREPLAAEVRDDRTRVAGRGAAPRATTTTPAGAAPGAAARPDWPLSSSDGPPQSRKWSRDPSSAATTNPSGSARRVRRRGEQQVGRPRLERGGGIEGHRR